MLELVPRLCFLFELQQAFAAVGRSQSAALLGLDPKRCHHGG